MTNIDALVSAAKSYALSAASMIFAEPIEKLSVRTKSSSSDMVTSLDTRVEAHLMELIRSQFPNDSIVSEEGASHEGTSGISWIIDPIDGTTNLIYQFPSYSVSIGVTKADEVIAAAVYSVPERSLYWAGKGLGAFKDSARLEVRQPVDPNDALIGTGFGYSPTRRTHQAEFIASLIGDIRDIRRTGAASLDLCNLAEGRLDGYVESGLWPWDYTGATLIVREAGGIVVGLDSDAPSSTITIAATTIHLAEFLSERVRPWLPFRT